MIFFKVANISSCSMQVHCLVFSSQEVMGVLRCVTVLSSPLLTSPNQQILWPQVTAGEQRGNLIEAPPPSDARLGV